MKPVFADTFYFEARFNPRDAHHERVLAWSREHIGPLVTTELILIELANGLARSHFRLLLADFFAHLRKNAVVVAPTDSRMNIAWRLYHQHEDKSWSFTDCFSFVAMRELGLKTALTSDRHFQQAGFVALFA